MHRMLKTRKEIAAFCGVHPDTISRWIAKHGLPATYLPNNVLATTTSLIDLWIRVRWELQQKKIRAYKAGKPVEGYVEQVESLIDAATEGL